MFTVIICSKNLINDIKVKYGLYLKPLLDDSSVVFCEWNTQGSTLNEAVPKLIGTVASKKEWRAVVVNDRSVLSDDLMSRQNPFDYAGTKKVPQGFKSKEEIIEYRRYVDNCTETAMNNPLMKLSVWLNGYPVPYRPQVESEETVAAAVPFSADYLNALKAEQVSPLDWETSYARARRFDRVNERFLIEGELFYPPKSVIAIAERTKDIELLQAVAAWKNFRESDYSSFAEVNLYSSKIRFLVYQMPTIRGISQENEYFTFLASVMVFAGNDISSDAVKAGKVYRLETVLNESNIKNDCGAYISMLTDSLDQIAALRRSKSIERSKKVDDGYVMQMLESDVTVSVKLSDNYQKDTLMCDHNEIGLSTDCPNSEEHYWNSQYSKIKKHFTRFLRQPYRSIKEAVETDFSEKRSIDDLRSKRLNEYQQEDILCRLQEEEQNMVETGTSRVFDKKRYDEMLSRSDREIKRGISQRMTQKMTIILGVILLVLTSVSFVPLFISQFNGLGTSTFTMLLFGVSLGIVAVAMLGCLFLLRQKLVEKFKGFNNTMSGIYSEVTGSMTDFSAYLSHACNVMREFSVLNSLAQKNDFDSNVFDMHEYDVKKRLEEVYRLFPEFTDAKPLAAEVPEQYRYDFSQPVSYPYDFPCSRFKCSIPFLSESNVIDVPVDYISSIILKREELYD